jgi:penicillin-binding protein 2
MAYRRRTRGSNPWPTVLVFLVVIGISTYALRTPLKQQWQRVTGHFDRLAQSPAAAATTVGVLPTPTFTVAVESPLPLANVPAPDQAAETYLADWSAGKYDAMYGLLSQEAQASLTQKQFDDTYTGITQEAGILKIITHITAVPMIPAGAGDGASLQVPFTVQFDTVRVGSFSENNSVPVVLENGQWRVDWRPSLIFSELAPGDQVRLFPLNPRRGSILDRKGRPLAIMGFQETIGVVPKDLNQGGHEDQTLSLIGQYLKKTPDQLKAVFAGQPPDWFIPLGDVAGSLEPELQQKLAPLPGVQLRRKPIRVYPQGEVASHVVGYVGHITTDELKQMANQGYTVDDIIGRAGVEQWAEPYLAGVRGGKLAVVAPTGEVIKVIAQKDAVPGDDVVLSIDIDIQREAESILNKLDGSVIVMNPQDNSVLALAAYPNFDPNKFVTGFTPQEWAALNNSPDNPFLDRPAEATFPTGSIFKVITMSAGMEALGYKTTDTFDCNYWWNGLPGHPMHNWTIQGTLNLVQSLTGSCDPTFYTIGLALTEKDPNILPQFARAFGLGQKTGINGVDESVGTVPDPAWKEKTFHQPWYPGDGVNLAIGQGYLLATPLQMANAYSALANNGLRRSPVLVQKIVNQQGQVVKSFEPQVLGHLPDSPATLAAIKAGMLGTTSTPLGTAYYAFKSYTHPMEAKTGSAENQSVLAHAWFVGYAPPDNPQYLILVMVEGRGESMQIASPMADQLMEFLMPSHPPTPSRPAAGTAAPAAVAAPVVHPATPTPVPRPAATPVARVTATPPAPTPKPPTAHPTPGHAAAVATRSVVPTATAKRA